MKLHQVIFRQFPNKLGIKFPLRISGDITQFSLKEGSKVIVFVSIQTFCNSLQNRQESSLMYDVILPSNSQRKTFIVSQERETTTSHNKTENYHDGMFLFFLIS